MVWNLSHFAEVVTFRSLDRGVSLALGCSYKYLNGEPAVPAFLYVREDLQDTLLPPMLGWFADWRLLNSVRISPRQPEQRGSHVSLRHPEGYRNCRDLIEPVSSRVKVIPDFRESDNIRLGVAPQYSSFLDMFRAAQRLEQIARKRE